MADTTVGTGDAQAVKRWSNLFTTQAIGRTRLRQLIGTRPNSPIQLHRDLQQNAGDEVKYDLTMQLTGYGKFGDSTLKGNEQSIVWYQDSLLIDQMREGIVYASMSQQRTLHRIRMEGMDLLADFYARGLEEMTLGTLAGTAGDNTALGTAAGSFGGLTITPVGSEFIFDKTSLTPDDTNKMTVDFITMLRENAKYGPGGGTKPIIRPVRTEQGEDIYFLFLHPYQVTSLKTEAGSSKWREIVQNAAERGRTNPIFSGALGMWDGVVLYESNYVPRGNTGGASGYTLTATNSADVNFAVLLGAQAGHWAWGRPYGALDRRQDVGRRTPLFTFMEDVDDYGNRTGVAGASIFGVKGATFNNDAYGRLVLATQEGASN